MALLTHFPAVDQYKVAPSEIDEDQFYTILHPSISPSLVGTVAPGTVNGTFVIDSPRLTFARNLMVSAAGAGSYGGTAVVTGKNQFGEVISETFAIAAAASGGTTAGTKVFGYVTSATWTVGGTGAGTPNLGFQIGTSSTGPLFGLPTKIRNSTDVKSVAWIDADTYKETAVNVNTSQHAVRIEVAGGIVAADSFVVKYRSSYDPSSEQLMAKL